MLSYSLHRGEALKISELELEVMSAEQIRRGSVVRVTQMNMYARNMPHENGLLDLRMGPLDRRRRCGTCGHDVRTCPGHFGHIELPYPCIHVGYLDDILKVLRSVCFWCSHLLSSAEAPAEGAHESRDQFAAMYGHCRLCKKCPRCKGPQPAYNRNGFDYRADWFDAFESDAETALAKRPLDARQIKSILDCIPDEDAAAMGFRCSHPRNCVLDTIVVPPPIARPTVMANEGAKARGQDDLTYKLQDINRRCAEVRAALGGARCALHAPEPALSDDALDRIHKLQLEVGSYMNSNIKAPRRQANKSVVSIKSVSDRLKGKEGRIRGNLMGKRVNQTARSPICPDTTMDVDQVGVPYSIATVLTIAEKVTPGNCERLTARVRKGAGRVDGAENILTSDGYLFQLQFCQSLHTLRLEVGWTVERYLQDDDYVLFNRQPSLHRMGMLAHRVKLMDGSCFKLNLCTTSAYNADFDGDEMNMHVLQSGMCHMEMACIMAVPMQLITPAANKPVMGIVQDTLLGAGLLTAESVWLERRDAMRLVSTLRYPKRAHDALLPDAATVCERRGPLWTGRQLFSVLLPDDFEYRRGEAADARGALWIVRGEMISGVVNKAALGASSNSIVDVMYRTHGHIVTIRFMSDVQRLVNHWLLLRGFNVGISDCVLDAAATGRVRAVVEEAIGSIDAIHSEPVPSTQASSVEATTNRILSKVIMNVSSIVESSLDESNSIRCMVKIGSKGNPLNLSQTMACVGQQSVNGARACAGMRRTLPCFDGGSCDVRSYGFVESSYIRGLSPTEYFFHAMGGREGLVDTAVKTAETGYMQRRLVKGMEDNRVEQDGTVRVANGQIVSFSYGADGMDPCKLERQRCDALHTTAQALREWCGGGADAHCAADRAVFRKQASRLVALQALVAAHRSMGDSQRDILVLPVNPARMFAALQRDAAAPAATAVECDQLLARLLAALPEQHAALKFCVCYHLCARRLVAAGVSAAALEREVLSAARTVDEAHVAPGEMVGAIAAQSVGEPTTQMTLNTFHAAGIGSQLTHGVPRFRELIEQSKNIHTPSMSAFLHKQVTQAACAEQVAVCMVQTVLADVVEEVRCVPCDESELWCSASMCFENTSLELTRSMCRMRLRKAVMMERHVGPNAIASMLNVIYGDSLCFYSSDDNMLEWLLGVRARRDDAIGDEQLLMGICKELLTLQLSGIPGVTHVHTEQQTRHDDTPCFRLCTRGINAPLLALFDLVDMATFTLNDVDTAHQVLGIEAAAAILYREIEQTICFDGAYIDGRHILQIVDMMTFEGGLMPLTRHGINRAAHTSSMTRISFEETIDLLHRSALFNEVDAGRGITKHVMTGQLGPMGTGIATIKIPPKKSVKEQRRVCKSRVARKGATENVIQVAVSTTTSAFPFIDHGQGPQTTYDVPCDIDIYTPPTPRKL